MRAGCVIAMLAACGPTAGGSDVDGDGGGSADGESDDGGSSDAVPLLAWERVPTTCGTAEAVLVIDEDTFVVAGTAAIVSGWLTRFDVDGDELWSADADEPLADLDAGPGADVWAAGDATIAGWDLEGTPTEGPPDLELAADVDLHAIAHAGGTWWIGGRAGDAPTDGFLAEIDADGDLVELVDTPMGSGIAGSWIRAIERSGSLVAACGIAADDDSSVPWLWIDDGGDEVVVSEARPDDDYGACIDVAVGAQMVARCEIAPPAIVASDASGEETWRVETAGARPAALVVLPDGDVVVAAGTASAPLDEPGWLRRLGADGEIRWSIPLADPELQIADLALVDDGALVLVGSTPGTVGECNEAWVGRYELPSA